uniref:Uncharacterized protein n=1 Tax=Panstrongylus lignarius TaxID=156445 RepID=A0A224XRP0_9HEMI
MDNGPVINLDQSLAVLAALMATAFSVVTMSSRVPFEFSVSKNHFLAILNVTVPFEFITMCVFFSSILNLYGPICCNFGLLIFNSCGFVQL